jgi:hypothetical protein
VIVARPQLSAFWVHVTTCPGPVVDVVELAADSDLEPMGQRIVGPAVEAHAILTVAGRDRRAAREGVGDDVGDGERRGLVVASVVGCVTANAELRQRPRGQSERIVRQMHIAVERARAGTVAPGRVLTGRKAAFCLRVPSEAVYVRVVNHGSCTFPVAASCCSVLPGGTPSCPCVEPGTIGR